MTEPLVTRIDDGRLATVTLNRPDKLNALNLTMFEELRAHLDALATDTTIGCVVLTGAGRSFCAGNDLAAIASGDRPANRLFQPETVDALELLPMPTIGKIRGHCFTGGLELALSCDLLVAGASAQFGDTHGQWGLAPVWGMSVRLPERVGRSRAKDLMFTGRRIDGTEAAAIGLVDRVTEDDALDATVATLASAILDNSPGTNRIDKALVAGPPGGGTRAERLAWERSMPFGLPDDMAERLSRRAR